MSEYKTGDRVRLKDPVIETVRDGKYPYFLRWDNGDWVEVMETTIVRKVEASTIEADATPKGYVARFVYEVAVEEASGPFHAAQLATEDMGGRGDQDIRESLYLLDVREGER